MSISIAVLNASAVRTNPAAKTSMNHSVLVMLKYTPRATTMTSTTMCIQALCVVFKKSQRPLPALAKLFALFTTENSCFGSVLSINRLYQICVFAVWCKIGTVISKQPPSQDRWCLQYLYKVYAAPDETITVSYFQPSFVYNNL